MNKTKCFSLVFASVAVALLFLGNWAAPVQADIENSPTPPVSATPFSQVESPEIIASKVPDEIKNTIQAYFALRYQLLSVSPPADIQQNVFSELVSSRDDAKDFLITETAKLAVERKWYELKGLRYVKYEYSLKYVNISLDTMHRTAAVSLIANYAIMREGSTSITKGDISHEIVLNNEQGQWKIVSDTYWDSWWREFRKPGLSTSEILNDIELTMQRLDAMPSPTP